MTLFFVAMLTLSPVLADKLDDVRARGKLVVGVAEASPPFSFRDRDNGVVGYDIDLAAEVAKRLGVGLAKSELINAERIPSVRDNRVDLIASGMTRSAGRARDIDFSIATFVSPHKILVRRDGAINAVGELAGRTLALVRSATVDKDLMQAVPTLRIVFFDDYRGAFDALTARQVDSFLADELLLLSFVRRSGAPEDYELLAGYELPRTAGLGLKKNEPRFTDVVNRTLLELEASGAAQKIFNTWFAPLRRPFVIKPD